MRIGMWSRHCGALVATEAFRVDFRVDLCVIMIPGSRLISFPESESQTVPYPRPSLQVDLQVDTVDAREIDV